jgi:hypothetical protein
MSSTFLFYSKFKRRKYEMFIPSKYANNEASEATTEYKCKYCNGVFNVPKEEVEGQKVLDVCDSPECSEKYNKEISAMMDSLMKPKTDAEDTIKAALGN